MKIKKIFSFYVKVVANESELAHRLLDGEQSIEAIMQSPHELDTLNTANYTDESTALFEEQQVAVSRLLPDPDPRPPNPDPEPKKGVVPDPDPDVANPGLPDPDPVPDLFLGRGSGLNKHP
uniref:FH2 domain-containing protein n=1 Tax=Globodera pallida TaxID=36090 RepID=A0A183C0G0_GLOPA